MDIVYLCRTGENEELRYSLRSIKNMPHDQVWIFGGTPNWVRNLRHFRTPAWANKHETTQQSLRAACTNPKVSDPFILMNDDFYVMRPGGQPPIANRGTVREVIAQQEANGSGNSGYTEGMRQTLARLEQHGYADPLSFELHMPLIVHKQAMLDALDLCAGIPVMHKRTAYGAVAGLRGRKFADVKIYRHGPIPNGRFLSTQDDSLHRALPLLQKAFPHPGKHEV